MKQSKTMYYLPGIIVICLGIFILTIETPDRTIRFGADFYTETYQAIATVAHIIKVSSSMLLIAWGTVSLGKGSADAGRSDLILDRLDALEQAIVAENVKSGESDAESSEPAANEPALTPTEPEVLPVEPMEAAAEQPVGPEPPAEVIEGQNEGDSTEESAAPTAEVEV